MIKIKNKNRKMQCYNLETDHFKHQKGENGKGKPESITFLGLEKRDCPKEVLECEEIKSAVKRGDLRVLGSADKKKVKKT